MDAVGQVDGESCFSYTRMPRMKSVARTENRSQEAIVLSVAALTAQIKGLLEAKFPGVWVSGEISDLSRPRSGHVYFTLKDESAQIRAVMWRSTAERLTFDLSDGMEIIGCGDVEVYPPRGSYQLIVRQVEPQGLGALQLAFRRLHAKLSAEGLFEARHKKNLPTFPCRVAVVTSPTGAAIRDLWEVMRRRWPNIHVTLIPVRVQGEGAAREIAKAIETANRLATPPDVLVVCRGGGSVEDLWCFNEEPMVRAIFASQIPVVSAVGHEIDVTLSDLVADVRALTPTEAGEVLLPSSDEIQRRLHDLGNRLVSSLRRQAIQARTRLDGLAQRRVFLRPYDLIHESSRRLDELDGRATRALLQQIRRTRERLQGVAGKLESLSPLGVLGRGYSVTWRSADGALLHDSSAIEAGEEITTRLAQGQVISRVERRELES